LLQASVPLCLEIVESERHKFQVDVLSCVDSLIAKVEGKKRGAIGETEGGLAEIEVEKDAAVADTNCKNALSTAKKSECDEKQVVVDEARKVAGGAQHVLTEAHKEEEVGNAKKARLLAEQEGFTQLLAAFQSLKEGTLQGTSQKHNKVIGELKKKLTELGATGSLADALAETMKLKPQKRGGSFAKATIGFAEELFDKHTVKVVEDIAACDAEATTFKKSIADAEVTAAEKKAVLEAVEKDWDQMQDVWVQLESESSSATRILKQIENRIPTFHKRIDKLKEDLDKFLEVPALFAELKEHSTKARETPEELAPLAQEPPAESEVPDAEMAEAVEV